MLENTICVILTGGQSRRMGTDKALLPLDGEALCLRLAEEFAPLVPVYFAVDRAGRFPTGRFGELVDRFPGQGPLNGIVSAFRGSDAAFALLVATDMPCCTPAAAERLAGAIGGHDACLYGNEPLFGLYTRRCLPVAEACLAAGQNAMRGFLDQISTRRLSADDPALFTNLNTPEELQAFRHRHETE